MICIKCNKRGNFLRENEREIKRESETSILSLVVLGKNSTKKNSSKKLQYFLSASVTKGRSTDFKRFPNANLKIIFNYPTVHKDTEKPHL